VSLRWRLAAILAVLVAVAIGTGTLVSYLGTRAELYDQVDDFLVGRARDVASGDRGFAGLGGEGSPNDGIPGGGPFGPGGAGGPNRPPVEADATIQVIDEDGEALYSSTGEQTLPVDDQDLAVADGADSEIRSVTVDGVESRMITAPVQGGGAVQVARDITEEQEVLDTLATRMVVVTLFGAFVAGLVGFLVAQRLTRPLRRLALAAEQVADTQELTPAPIEVHRKDEVGRLATAFNTMLVALDTSRRQQHRLVQDASHELRTPLTSLRTSIEVLDRARDLESADARKLLDRATFELAELSELVTELVELATDTATDEEPEELELDRLVADVVEQARRRTGRTIELSSDTTTVFGRPTGLARALRNLVGNATKFSPSDQPIEVHVGEGRVDVLDRGPGIPAEDQERIFDRFYRSTATRTQPGSGLGLAIVDQVVKAHGGEVWAKDRDGGGASVGFQIPELPPEAAPTS
jgi:two-component system sensor histidine kinase MprB